MRRHSVSTLAVEAAYVEARWAGSRGTDAEAALSSETSIDRAPPDCHSVSAATTSKLEGTCGQRGGYGALAPLAPEQQPGQAGVAGSRGSAPTR